MNVAVVTEVLALLEAFGRERPTPAAARARAKQLEAGLPGHRLTVLSQEEQFDGRFQHDLLLRRRGKTRCTWDTALRTDCRGRCARSSGGIAPRSCARTTRR
jgi:hypothetical protein